MKLIETKTLGADAASIEFTSIPQTYTDLVLVLSCRTTRLIQVGDGYLIKPNNTTPTARVLTGDGSTAYSDTGYTGIFPTAATTANTFGNAVAYFPNYSNTTTNKSFSVDDVSENNATGAFQTISANLYSSTSAITSLKIESINATNIVANSTISLYGITKGSDGIVTTS
jgi:hypothetical protein